MGDPNKVSHVITTRLSEVEWLDLEAHLRDHRLSTAGFTRDAVLEKLDRDKTAEQNGDITIAEERLFHTSKMNYDRFIKNRELIHDHTVDLERWLEQAVSRADSYAIDRTREQARKAALCNPMADPDDIAKLTIIAGEAK